MAQKFLTGVQLTNGSAGSPALSFSSDTNTGIYRSAEDHLSVSVNGSARLTVSVNGITSSSNVYSGSNGQFRNYSGVWKATTGTSGNGFEFTSADQTGAMTLSSNGNLKVHNNIRSQGHSTTGLSGKGMELRFFTDTDIGSILSYDRSNNVYLPIGVFGSTVSLQTGGTERLHITNAGNVGIGIAPASIGQKLRVNGNIKVGDSQKFIAGAGNDLEIQHTGTHSFITNVTGDLTIANYADDRSIYFQSDDGGGGSTNYMQVDGSTVQIKFLQNTKHVDNIKALFGASNDLEVFHQSSSSNSFIQNNTGNLRIIQNTNDGDITFECDDGSGGVTEYFRVDGGGTLTFFSKPLQMADNQKIFLGDSGDLSIYHNGTNSYIQNGTGNLFIEATGVDKDIYFLSDDGSGGETTYFFLDGSSVTTQFYKTIKLYDAAFLYIGDGNDLQFYHNGTNSTIANYTGTLYIANNQNDGDIAFQCDDGSGGIAEYILIDGSAEQTKFSKDTKHIDNARGKFGDSNDLSIFHNGSNSYIENTTGDLLVVNYADDGDIKFWSDNGSGGTAEYFRVDGGTTSIVVSASLGMYFNDGVAARFGNQGDALIYHDGTNSYFKNLTGNLIIEQNTDDADLIFRCDDGLGGVTDYFKLDGSDGNVKVYKQFGFLDNVKATFGSSGDLQIYHNSAHSFIDGSSGTGSLYIRPGSGNTVQIEDKDGNDMITASPTEVRLLYNNSEKLATTSTGVSITGDLIVSGTTTTVNQTNLDVSDNIIGLNRGSSTNTNDSGLIIERGSTGDNAAFLWDESEDKFVFGLTTATPSATGDVALSDYRGIKTGPITASGNITASGSYFADTHFRSTDGNATLSATGGGGVYLRPNGFSSTTGQVLIDASNGDATFSGGLSVSASGSIYGTDNQIASIYMTGSGYGLSGKFGSYARNLIRSNGTNTIQIGDNTSLISLIQLKAGSSSVDGVIQLMTHNTERMRITHDGKVGVNTSSPGAKLHVVESTTNTQALRVDDGTSFVSVVPSLGGGGYTGVSTAGDIGLIFSIDGDSSTDTSNGLLIAPHTQTSGGLKILENGNVGISIASPGHRLHVSSGGSDTVAGFKSTDLRARIAIQDTADISYFGTYNGTTFLGTSDTPSSSNLQITHDGKVGIGTSSPQAALHVAGAFNTNSPTGNGVFMGYYNSTHGYIQLNGSSGGYIDFSTSGVDHKGRILYDNNSNYFRFDTNGTERIRINSSGNVGVGTTAPQTNTKLEVSGAIKAGNKTSWSDRDDNPLTTTGRVVAGLTGNANGNGASAMYIFTCYGGNGYQRIVYSCRNQSGTWVVNKDIDEGVDAFDVVASTPSSGSAVTFTFKGRTSSQSYTASVFIEHMGHNLDTQYVG